ncbi:MAG: hypothetical protein ACP5T9_03125 [Thermoplasmata archaeon]
MITLTRLHMDLFFETVKKLYKTGELNKSLYVIKKDGSDVHDEKYVAVALCFENICGGITRYAISMDDLMSGSSENEKNIITDIIKNLPENHKLSIEWFDFCVLWSG